MMRFLAELEMTFRTAHHPKALENKSGRLYNKPNH
jgi:hypothetical protein